MESNNPIFGNAGNQILLGSRTNVLLVKDDVGKAKPNTRAVPRGDFAFGKPAAAEIIESAQEVTQNWQFHNKTGKKSPDPRDFMKLNKMCIKEKATDAKASRAYRGNHDARLQIGKHT